MTEPKKPSEPDTIASVLAIAATLADTTWRIAVPTLGLALTGLWADLKYGTKPWLTLAGTVIGFGIAGVLIKRQLKDLS